MPEHEVDRLARRMTGLPQMTTGGAPIYPREVDQLCRAVLERGQRIAELEAQLSSCMHEQQRVKAELSGYVDDVRRAEALLDPQALTIAYMQGWHDRDDEVARLKAEKAEIVELKESLEDHND